MRQKGLRQYKCTICCTEIWEVSSSILARLAAIFNSTQYWIGNEWIKRGIKNEDAIINGYSLWYSLASKVCIEEKTLYTVQCTVMTHWIEQSGHN